jgi:hypothetical protein
VTIFFLITPTENSICQATPIGYHRQQQRYTKKYSLFYTQQENAPNFNDYYSG